MASVKATKSQEPQVPRPASSQPKNSSDAEDQSTEKMSTRASNHDQLSATSDHDQSDTPNQDAGNEQLEKEGANAIIGPEELSSPEPKLLQQIALSMQHDETVNPQKICESDVRSNQDSTDEEQEDMDFQPTEDEQPQSITIELVWQMFRDLKKEMKIKKHEDQLARKKIKKDCIEGAAIAADQVVQYHETNLTKVKSELAHYKNKCEILAGICNGLNTEVVDLTQRVEMLELNNTK